MCPIRFRGLCEMCRAPLSHRRKGALYCGAACKQRAYRERSSDRAVRYVTCALCGDDFATHDLRLKWCPRDAASPECEELRDAIEMKRDWPQNNPHAPCLHCGQPVGGPNRGRPRRYCCPAHRKAAERGRKEFRTE